MADKTRIYAAEMTGLDGLVKVESFVDTDGLRWWTVTVGDQPTLRLAAPTVGHLRFLLGGRNDGDG